MSPESGWALRSSLTIETSCHPHIYPKEHMEPLSKNTLGSASMYLLSADEEDAILPFLTSCIQYFLYLFWISQD